jgi:hypothetical protein
MRTRHVVLVTYGEPQTPAFLEQVVAAGEVRVRVGEGEKKVQDLRIR